jgi:FixJ family two-component response regulator
MAEAEHSRVDARARVHALTLSELRILRCIANGASNHAIAELLGTRPREAKSTAGESRGEDRRPGAADAVRIAIYVELDQVGYAL